MDKGLYTTDSSGNHYKFDSTGFARGIFGGGYTGSNINTIDYVIIASAGNATDFGDLTSVRVSGGVSSISRGVFAGGWDTVGKTNVINYITISTNGNYTDFGDLTVDRYSLAGVSSSIRGCFGAGGTSGSAADNVNVIDYITIATTGNALDFGDLTVKRYALGSVNSSTRGCFCGGYLPTEANSNTIDYITIASASDATDFGDLTLIRCYMWGGCSSDTRGVLSGGYTTGWTITNVIDYITIASAGNATDFGDLTYTTDGAAATSSRITGVLAGGASGGYLSTIHKITIATTSNSSSFGNLTVARDNSTALSNAHGGLY